MCGVCETSIQKVLEVVKETWNGQVVGSNMLVEVCSTCRVLGLDKVKSAFKDFQTKDLNGNIRAFEKLKMFRDGSSKLPLNKQIMNKEPSKRALSTSMRDFDKKKRSI